MTSYAMELRGTQHVRPRPRVRVEDDRRPQARPAVRQAPVSRPEVAPQLAGARAGVSACQVASPVVAAPRHRAAVARGAEAGLRLTARGAAVVSMVFSATMIAALATVVLQFLAVTA